MVTNFKKNIKGKRDNHFLLHAGGVVILIVLVFLVVTNIRIYQKRKEFKEQVSNLQAQIEDLKQSNSELEEGIEGADDKSYIEKVAREELDLQKPGEQVVSFVDGESEEASADGGDSNVLQTWLGNSWNWIKDLF